MVNFEPGEYIRKMIFQSVTKAKVHRFDSCCNLQFFFRTACVTDWKIIFLTTMVYQKMFSFPMQKSTKDTTLDVGEDQVVLHVHPARYHLDLGLPFDVDSETCGAQYNRKTKVKSRYKKNKMLLCIFSHWQRNLTNKPH